METVHPTTWDDITEGETYLTIPDMGGRLVTTAGTLQVWAAPPVTVENADGTHLTTETRWTFAIVSAPNFEDAFLALSQKVEVI